MAEEFGDPVIDNVIGKIVSIMNCTCEDYPAKVQLTVPERVHWEIATIVASMIMGIRNAESYEEYLADFPTYWKMAKVICHMIDQEG